MALIQTPYPIASIDGITVVTFLPCNPFNYDYLSRREVDKIVIHYTGNQRDSAYGNANYFHSGVRGASAHYFVDESSYYQSVRLTDVAWHAGWYPVNKRSIGIEMCCSGDYRVSAKTIHNTAKLVAALCKMLGISAGKVDTAVIRHYDVTSKWCPAQMAGKNNKEWAALKAAIKANLGSAEAPAPSQPAPVREETTNVTVPILRRGDKSGYVMTTQILLNEYFDAGLATDGDFGGATYRAVIAYQKDRGLEADGIIGAKTWSQLLK